MNSDDIDNIIQTQMPGFELVKEETRQPLDATVTADSAAPPQRIWKKFVKPASAPAAASKATAPAADSVPAIDDLRTKFIRPNRERPRARPQSDSTSGSEPAGFSTTGARQGKTILRHIRPIGSTDSDRQSPNTKAVLIKDGKIYSSQG
jgi:hypothetical protein